jgi:hypothetical protein
MLGALGKIAAAPLSPTFTSLEKARAYNAALTRAEYALARVVASEAGPKGTPTEMACLADATLNHAGGRELEQHVTASLGFGAQDGRPFSTAQSPGPRHIEAALAVLRRGLFGLLSPPMRGVVRGADRFLSPRAQDDLAGRGSAKHCPALVILERWTFDRAFADRSRCTLSAKNGPDQREWIGLVAGVDSYRQMFLRPATAAQAALYADARRVIESRGQYQGSPLIAPLPDVVVVAAVVGAAYLLRGVA